MTVDKGAMDAAGDSLGVFGKNFGMGRISQIEKNNTVFAVGCAFARKDADFSVRSGAEVIDHARIEWERIHFNRLRRIRNVVNPQAAGDDRRHIGVVTDDPLFRRLEFFLRCASNDLEFANHITRCTVTVATAARSPLTAVTA